MPLPKRLFVIRHGETDWNAEGRYQGQRDIPLNTRGRAQAARNGMALAAALADAGLKPHALHFIVSPLSRARETFELVRQGLSRAAIAARFDPAVREIGFGAWEGSTWAELKRADPIRAEQRRLDPFGFTPPGGESYADLSRRVLAAAEGFPEDTVLVAHGGVAKVLRGAYLELNSAEIPNYDVPQSRFFCFEPGCAALI